MYKIMHKTVVIGMGCDSREIFSGLKIAESPAFERELTSNLHISQESCQSRSTVLSLHLTISENIQ